MGTFFEHFIGSFGRFFLLQGQGLVDVCRFCAESVGVLLSRALTLKLRLREIIDQTYFVMVKSFPVIALSLSFTAFMLIAEFSFHMKLVLREDSLVPSFSTLLLLRELGPTVTCFLLTSKVGAAMAAEIGTMKITDQIEALKLLNLEPLEFLGTARWIACVVGSVALSVLSVVVACAVSVLLGSKPLGMGPYEYFNTMFTFTRMADLQSCVIKSAVFGSIIALTAMYHGLRCTGGSEGVGRASTRAVVHSSVLIILADFFLSSALYGL